VGASATSFPLSKHTGGGDTAPAFSGLRVCLQLTWEVGLPPLLWSFPPSSTLASFPAPGCWACAAAPALSSQARLVYLQSGRDFPSPPSALIALCYVSLLFLLFIIQFLLFSLGGVGLSRGYADLSRVVCGSTMSHLAHLVVCVFPSHIGVGVWRRPGSSCFLCSM
jgi:hypothetical protein